MYVSVAQIIALFCSEVEKCFRGKKINTVDAFSSLLRSGFRVNFSHYYDSAKFYRLDCYSFSTEFASQEGNTFGLVVT